jgi:D-alanyl-D-alanine carboxypeptidase
MKMMEKNDQLQQNSTSATPGEVGEESRSDVSHAKAALFLVGVMILGIGLWYALSSDDLIIQTKQAEFAVHEEKVEVRPPDPYKDIMLEAKAVFMFDINSGEVLFARNEEMQLPLASLTKLMTVYTASKYFNDEDLIIINQDSLAEEGDSGLFANESWKFKDLTDFTLLVSSNDGANTLAGAAGALIAKKDGILLTETTFVDAMNAEVDRLGLVQTYFLNETGLDPTEQFSGSYGSARDVVTLLNHILHHKPDLLTATTFPEATFYSSENFPHEAENTNEYTGNIPGLIASKTGFTDLAGGNLIIVLDVGINHPIAVAILGSSVEGRFSDAEKLVSAALIDIAQ